jgi:hypothetical protein
MQLLTLGGFTFRPTVKPIPRPPRKTSCRPESPILILRVGIVDVSIVLDEPTLKTAQSSCAHSR